jgi:heme-degrading monooxygenase HmoA
VTEKHSNHATVQVRHFFHQRGLRDFPKVFAEHCRLASGFPGFVVVTHSVPARVGEGAEVEMVVTVEFESHAELLNWRASARHAEVAAAYRGLWSREPEVTFPTSS